MNEFRLLTASEIECRVSQINEKGLSLLLYKTARTDANLLDETVGAGNWQNDFKVVDGVLYGGIGITNNGNEIWKWDAGTESNTEAEKGRASDAFKRAGFKWGIGRELYTAPFIWVSADKYEAKETKGRDGKTKYSTNDRFSVKEISYNGKAEIVKLSIINEKQSKIVFSFVGSNYTHENQKSEIEANITPTEAPDGYYYCSDCGNIITGFNGRTEKISEKNFAIRTIGKYGRQLCKDCARKHAGQID